MKKSKASTKKLAAKAKDERPVAAKVTKAIPKKPSPAPKIPKTAPVEATKPVVLTSEMTILRAVNFSVFLK